MDKYRKIKHLASGSYGDVSLRENILTKKLYACKRVSATDNEISKISKLNNKHVIQFIEYHVGTDHNYIIMEYATIHDLHSEIKKWG